MKAKSWCWGRTNLDGLGVNPKLQTAQDPGGRGDKYVGRKVGRAWGWIVEEIREREGHLA